jgi:hypothetical protein
VREPDAGIVHDTQRRGAGARHPWGRDCKSARSGHPSLPAARVGSLVHAHAAELAAALLAGVRH